MSRRILCLSLLSLFIIFITYEPAQGAPTQTISQNSTGNHTLSPDDDTRIVNGLPAENGMFPWQAAVILDAFFCGGSIITPIWILSAGHCVKDVKLFTVTVGSIYRTKPVGTVELDRQTVRSVVGVPHPLYLEPSTRNDIGLIRLPRPLIFSLNVAPIALPRLTDEYVLLDAKPVLVSGWGKTTDDKNSSPDRLRYTDLTVIPGDQCKRIYGAAYDLNTNICCWDKRDHSTCNGDSGGPVIYRGLDGLQHEVGIVSFGAKISCVQGFPSVFTRVTAYLDFIKATIAV